MKRLITFLLCLFITLCNPFYSNGQVLIGAEYFINIDPGAGNGVPIKVTNFNGGNVSLAISPNNLIQGFNQLFIRVRDQNNNWSIAEQRTFYVYKALNVSSQPIVVAEYFIDKDPGIGKGIALNISEGDTLNTIFNVNTTGLSVGFHQLFIRIKDKNESWSIPERRSFYIGANFNIVPSPIKAAEYFVNVDSGAGHNTQLALIKAGSVDTNYNYVADNLPLGKYTMNLRVKDSLGNWSIVESRPFTVCSNYAPISNFEFAVIDSNVSFINNSQYASSYHWNFGNIDTSNLPNPYYTCKPGVYNACLISKNECLPKGDTLCKTVSILGLTAINTNHGGNTGTVSVSITGGGFIPGMQLYLHEAGQQDIYGDTLIVESSALMTTTFDLTGKNIGLWDVIAGFPNGKADTLHNGFTIEAGTQPKLWVNITGDRVLRIGFNQIYTVTYGNTGNTDAVMVPLLITGLPIGTDIQVLNPLFRIDSLPEFDTLHTAVDSIQRTLDDSANNLSFRLFYLKKIAAVSSNVITLIFHVPATTRLHSYASIQVILGEPHGTDSTAVVPHNIQSPSSAQSKEKFDFDQFLDCLKSAADVAADLLDLQGWQACGTIALSTAATLASKFYATPPPDPFCQTCSNISDEGGLIFGSFETAQSCILAVTGAFCPISKVYKWVNITEGLLSKTLTYSSAGYSCGRSAANIIKVLIGNYWDPNSKYGIGDSSSNHYVRNLPISYVVSFENDPAANTNAPTVSILDTLNRAYYDYSSFGFNSVNVGDSIYSFINPVRSFTHDFDFSQQYGVKARVTATFDSTSGVAQWSFYSIDPVTNQQITNVQLGFLPPDKNSPKGQGYVSFTVNPASTIQNGDAICNKATIIFPPNAPIITDCWNNVFDLVNPLSRVNSLPAKTSKDTFEVAWNGSDNLSGIGNYTIYVSINDSAFVPWIVDTSGLNAFYVGTVGNTYSFYSIATDNAGNIELPKVAGEASTMIVPDSSLPVTLLNFQSRCVSDKVMLTWQTANEINSSYFEIQKSQQNATGWNSIGTVNAAEFSFLLLNYQFIDDQNDGISFYRLRQVDKDGKSTFSQIIKTDCGSFQNSLQVYPIPVKNELNAQIQSNKNVSVAISLIDVYGIVISKATANLKAGTNNIIVDTRQLASGQYFLKVDGVEGIKTRRVVVIH